MKITDEVLKALHKCVEVCGSKTEFANRVNINPTSIGQYLNRKRQSIADETWEKLYPWLKPFLPAKLKGDAIRHIDGLESNQKILLDAYSVLPKSVQDEKLIEIVNLAREELRKSKSLD